MRENSKIKENLLQFIDYKGINKSEFYAQTGISNGVLTQKNGMSEEGILRTLSTFPELNAEWLILGVGDMIKGDRYLVNEPQNTYGVKTSEPKKEIQTVPLYDIEATAGLVPLFKDQSHQQPIDHITIPNLPKCDGALHVTGDSMYPLLKSGDIVIYKTVHDILNGIFWGEMYLLSIDNGMDEYVTVKYVQKSDVKGCVRLVSYNKHHQDKDVELEKIRALALVKASVRINSM